MKLMKLFIAIFVVVITIVFGAIVLEDALIGELLYNSSKSMEYYQNAPTDSVADEAFSSAEAEHNSLEAMKNEKHDGIIPEWFSSQNAAVQFLVLLISILFSCFSVAYLHGRWVIFTRTLKKAATTTRRA